MKIVAGTYAESSTQIGVLWKLYKDQIRLFRYKPIEINRQIKAGPNRSLVEE